MTVDPQPNPQPPPDVGAVDPGHMPGHHLQHQLEHLPVALPAVLMLGTGLTLAGAYTGNVQLIGVHDRDPSTVTVSIMLPACSCKDPDDDVDLDCLRHYPRPPAELVRTLALAVAASRGWAFGGIVGEYPVEGAGHSDVAAALAALTVLLQPGRNGIIYDPARPDGTVWHIGRGWKGTRLEDACPCPKAPCGLVLQPRADPACGQHGTGDVASIRQAHPADHCAAAR